MRKMCASSLCIVALCGAGLAWALDYTWSGLGMGNSWAGHGNWCFGFSCPIGYPDDTGDNATIPFTSAGYTVDLVDEQIGTLTCEGDVDFGTTGGNVTLEVITYHIDARDRSADIEVATATGVTIIANDFP